ncbi:MULTISPECIES: TIGR02921 family PEP-CTERM protein [Nostocales]|uniref:Exosortase n=3 Tax=Nostocales TaxID=1161 RepID=A0A0C1RDL9_9CYAN|nr:TIGR02921 family PEP-CTERM protein [Tolypothrix bouteillei]KAF3884391.1 TIGR02921 family PEP-CTERM protein [Tolypothrix bouteillei VB521301]
MRWFWNGLIQTIFWVWNVTFLLTVCMGILPVVGVPLVLATVAGEIPSEFFLTLVGLVAVPTVCTFLGAFHFRRQPIKLLRLFYGVEAPLFLLCLLRLFLIRELTPASTQILATIGICIVAFFLEMLFGYASTRKSGLQWLQMLAHSLMLLFGIYASAVLLFYALPLGAFLVQEFFKFDWARGLWQILVSGWWVQGVWYFLLFLILWILSTALFVVMPLALAALYINSGRRILQAFASQKGKKSTFTGASAVAIAWMTAFIILQQQPQVQAFSLLAHPASNDSTRQALLAKSNTIREGLVNAYLSSYRYLSTKEENNHISEMYRSVFGLSQTVANTVQESYNSFMSPFLYNGSDKDAEKAEKLYAEFFDTPLQKAERQLVSHAVQSTFNRQEVKAGLLNINEKKVWLRSQQIKVTEHGDWADLELYEVYKNQTPEVQEIFYSFSLPESAVITGLWLGDTGDLQKRFPFVIAPRGAAQKVYNSQVRRERPVDPALLEQVGPRQYRLRAFPIPPQAPVLQSVPQQRPTEMHLWLTYKVMRQESGWALPVLGEKRNIFWTHETKRIRNGKEVALKDEPWLEPFLPATGKFLPTLHQVNFPEGHSILVKPLLNKDYSLPQAKRFALVLDSSFSMNSHVKELSQVFTWLQKHGFADKDLANNDADLYITASKGAVPKRLDDIGQFLAEKMTFYGTIQPQEMLQQFNQLRGDTAYDGVLLLTDEGSYELSKDKVAKQNPGSEIKATLAPLWMIHLGSLPAAYDDATLKAIQDSGGGVSQQVSEVLQRVATKAVLGASTVSVVDGYAWYKNESDTKESKITSQKEDNFQQLAVRQLILGLSKEINLEQLETLDAIHAIAKKYELVTPYSSMLVLVNDEQRRLLKQAEAESDRFNRKIENGKEDLSKPNNPFKVSTNESSSGLMIGIVAIALLLLSKRSKRAIGN